MWSPSNQASDFTGIRKGNTFKCSSHRPWFGIYGNNCRPFMHLQLHKCLRVKPLCFLTVMPKVRGRCGSGEAGCSQAITLMQAQGSSDHYCWCTGRPSRLCLSVLKRMQQQIPVHRSDRASASWFYHKGAVKGCLQITGEYFSFSPPYILNIKKGRL